MIVISMFDQLRSLLELEMSIDLKGDPRVEWLKCCDYNNNQNDVSSSISENNIIF